MFQFKVIRPLEPVDDFFEAAAGLYRMQR